MAKLNFFGMMISLDVHEHANAEARQAGTMILGRRMYETLVSWETYSGDTIRSWCQRRLSRRRASEQASYLR